MSSFTERPRLRREIALVLAIKTLLLLIVLIRRAAGVVDRPGSSLTVWNASSSPKTLQIMPVVVAVFVPLIMLYTGWVHHVLRCPITVQHIRFNSAKFY